MTDKNITYQHIQEIFKKAETSVTPAELHGMLTALVCVMPLIELPKVYSILFEEQETSSDDDELIKSFIALEHEKLTNALKGLNLGFRLFLPGDDTPLLNRIEALSDFAKGFVGGLGLSGIDETKLQKDPLKEIIDDIIQIAKLQVPPDDLTLEEEDAYIELVEYLTIIVQNIHAELHIPDRNPENETMH